MKLRIFDALRLNDDGRRVEILLSMGKGERYRVIEATDRLYMKRRGEVHCLKWTRWSAKPRKGKARDYMWCLLHITTSLFGRVPLGVWYTSRCVIATKIQ